MDAIFDRGSFDMSSIFKFKDISADTQSHLFRVYSSLMATCLVCTLGCIACIEDTWYVLHPTLGSILSFASVIYIISTSGSAQCRFDENYTSEQIKRFAVLMIFGYTTGNSIGPLIDYALDFNPEIVTSAVALTTMIFLSFSLTALFAKRRSYLYLGGILGTTLNYLFWGSILNRFFRFQIMYDISTYLGLIMFSGYVIFDTQVIVEKEEE